MKRLSNWAIRRPVVFTLFVCVPGLLVILTCALVLAEWFRHSTEWGRTGAIIGTAIGLTLGAALLIELLRRFEWLHAAGFRRTAPAAWRLIVPPLLWIVSANFYVSSGTFDLDFSDPTQSLLLSVRMLATGLLEETMFRGVVLTAMLAAWAQQRHVVLKSVLLSSLVFGLVHLLNLGTRDSVSVIANSVYTCFTGVLFAGIAVRSGSIWPAIILHGVSNALLTLNRLGEPAPDWTPAYTSMRILVHLPLALYGLWLLRGARLRPEIHELGRHESG